MLDFNIKVGVKRSSVIILYSGSAVIGVRYSKWEHFITIKIYEIY
jgi:hypothetical protein